MKSNPMDQQSLREEYDEIKIKLIMARFAEIEGKRLQEENEELLDNSFYLPSQSSKQAFIKRVNLRVTLIFYKRALLQFHNRFGRYSKIAIVPLLFIVLLFTTVLSVEALRVKVLNMFVQVEREYTEIRFGKDAQSHDELQINWDNAYVPSKIPNGYRIVDVRNDQTMKLIEYRNDDKGYILFQQNNENTGMNVDTEEADEVIHTTIHGNDGLVVRKREVVSVLWQEYDKLLLITGDSTNLSKESLIEMAKSVKLIK